MKIILITLIFQLALVGCSSVPVRVEPGPVEKLLKNCELPNVQHFRNESMDEVVKVLAISTGCDHHEQLHPYQLIQGDMVVYELRHCPHQAHNDSPPCNRKGKRFPDFVTLGPTITTKRNKMKLYELLIEVTEQADAELEIRRDKVIIKMNRVEQKPDPAG